jgi:hypothetical protein
MSTVTDGLIDATHVDVYQLTSSPSVVWSVLDADGVAINLSAGSVAFYAYQRGSDTAVFTKSTTAGTIGISGASNNIATMTYTTANTTIPRQLEYRIFHTVSGSQKLVARGSFNILAAERDV